MAINNLVKYQDSTEEPEVVNMTPTGAMDYSNALFSGEGMGSGGIGRQGMQNNQQSGQYSGQTQSQNAGTQSQASGRESGSFAESAEKAARGYTNKAAGDLLGSLGVGSDLIGPGVGMVNMGIDAATGKNVDYGQSLSTIGGGWIGSMIGGIFGPTGAYLGAGIGSSLAKDSYNNGMIGDAFDARTNETTRDMVEDIDGFGYKDSKAASGMIGRNALSQSEVEGMYGVYDGGNYGITSGPDNTPDGLSSGSGVVDSVDAYDATNSAYDGLLGSTDVGGVAGDGDGW